MTSTTTTAKQPTNKSTKAKEPEACAYEKTRQKNIAAIQARFNALGINKLKNLMGSSTTPHSPVKAKQSERRKRDDADYVPDEEDRGSEGEDNDIFRTPTKKLYKRTVQFSEANSPRNRYKMPPGGTRSSKRVKATLQTDQPTGVSTRSSKVLALATLNEETNNAASEQQVHDDQGLRGQEPIVPPTSPVRDWSYEQGGELDQGTQGLSTNEDNNQQVDEDTPIATRRGKRASTMGKQLEKMTRTMGKRLPIQLVEGERRPHKSVQAAKFASEAGIQIRHHVPILTHWKEYKNNNSHFENFIGKLSTRLAIDTNDKPTKDACVDVLKGGVRQARYRLKKKYFDGIAANEVSVTSPVQHISNAEWTKLVQIWSDPKNKEISVKNKQNRSKVKFHQATGSRSYVAHCHSLKDKNKDKEFNAVDMFKECHNSKKKGLAEPVQHAIADMEAMMEPDADGETQSPTEIVAKVLTQKSATSKFLNNVGLKSSAAKTVKTSNEIDLEEKLRKRDELQPHFNKP